MNNSYWLKGKQIGDFPALDRDIDTDCAIIGGGLAGIICAEAIAKKGLRVCILDAGKIGQGETAGSSAIVSFAHDLIYSRLIKKHGEEIAGEYFRLNLYGKEKIESVISEYNITCGYKKYPMYLFSTTKKGAKDIGKEHEAYAQLGIPAQYTSPAELPYPTTGAFKIEDQSCIDPYDFVTGLAAALEKKGVEIYENTPVTRQPENNMVRVGGFTVRAAHFVIATHFPYIDFPGLYFTKMFQSRSHNIVFDSGKSIGGIYESAEDGGFEYRPVAEKILCGGANIRTGKYNYHSQYKIVEDHIAGYFDAGKDSISAKFSAQDCITFDMLPFAGRYSGFLDNVYLATGFNKWGFTTSAAAAKLIAAEITDGSVKNIFSPDRAYFSKAPLKAAKNIGKLVSAFAGLVVSFDSKKIRRIGRGQGAVVRYKGKRLGVFRDSGGNLEVVLAVCTHLGCSLKWNKDELSWDCPCHGSRFDTKGNILGGPAYKKLEIKAVNKNAEDI